MRRQNATMGILHTTTQKSKPDCMHVCKGRVNATVEYTLVYAVCPPKASTMSISQAATPGPGLFRYHSNLKYVPLKAASLAEQPMLALIKQPYSTPQSY